MAKQTLQLNQVIDPVRFVKLCWPDIVLSREQRHIMYSVRDNIETVVPAGHQLGKDFVTGLTVIWFFVSRSPCRVVTTSVDATQLEGVLWGEVRRFLQSSKVKLPIVVNHLLLRKIVNGAQDGLSYMIGRVAARGEGLSGHHIARKRDGIPRTLFVIDEASGVDQESYDKGIEWSHRRLIIGNPYPCENFFKHAVKGKPGSEDRGGDIKAPSNGHYLRKIIRIRAQDSPNVRRAEYLISKGLKPDGRMVIEGIIDYDTYLLNRQTWDPIKQCAGLDADFYEGALLLMFPPTWLNRAEGIAEKLSLKNRTAKAIGVDTGEGSAESVVTAVDEFGIIEQEAKVTEDTSVIPEWVLAFARKWNCPPERIFFDAGGGGTEHAWFLRKHGHNVQTVAFGETVSPPMKRGGLTPFDERKHQKEERYSYANRRAQMYHLVRLKIDPGQNPVGWGIPRHMIELRRQLAPVPLDYGEEGRIKLPPKNKRDPNSKTKTLTEILGCSPDRADSLVLAVYGMDAKGVIRKAGKAF